MVAIPTARYGEADRVARADAIGGCASPSHRSLRRGEETVTHAAYRHGDAFAGIGGFGLATRNVGWETTWACEIEPSARLVYSARLGHHELRFDRDIRISRDVPEFDILTAGFPCQDLSVAGKREGLAGARSGLFHHLTRILHGVRPEWFVFENVPGLLSSHQGRDMQTVLHGCSGFCPTIPDGGWGTSGGIVGPAYAVVWRVLNSQFFGVAQRRRRVFLVGHSSGDIRRAFEVLFEREGVRGDSPEIGKAGREPAAASRSSAAIWMLDLNNTGDGGNIGVRDASESSITLDTSGNIGVATVVAPLTQRAYGDGATDDPPPVAGTLQGGGKRGYRIDAEGARGGQLIASPTASAGHHGHSSPRGDGRDSLIAPTLRCGGMADAKHPADAGSDNVPVVAFQCHGSNVGPAGTLRAGNGNETGGVPFMAVSENQRGEVRLSELAPALGHGGGKPGQGYPAVAFNWQSGGSQPRIGGTNPYTDALHRSQGPAVAIDGEAASSHRVRASPELPGPLDLCPSCIEGPDSPRYRGLGNAVTVSVVQWILGRIEAQRR